MRAIVDTNVPVVANGMSPQASPECVIACVQHIDHIRLNGKIILDDQWIILKEYIHNLHSTGQPGVGDAFLLWVLQNQANRARCERVTIHLRHPTDSAEDEFIEFPDDPNLKDFDRADRKFIAVAIAHPEHPPISEATDTKWRQFVDVFKKHGVQIQFICQESETDRSEKHRHF